MSKFIRIKNMIIPIDSIRRVYSIRETIYIETHPVDLEKTMETSFTYENVTEVEKDLVKILGELNG